MLESSGQVLGIDVGYSPTKRTTGFCLLHWTADSVSLAFRRTTSDNSKRSLALIDLLAYKRSVTAVAVDGPIGPKLCTMKHYRSAEALLSQGVMQKRGKPGQTSSPTGQRLHAHATQLATLALDLCEIASATHRDAVHNRRLVEAFPNAFLVALMNDYDIPNLARNASDVFWAAQASSGGLDRLLDRLLPGRRLTEEWTSIRDHDDRASAICALTALSVVADDFVLVGDPLSGDIVLPPQSVWGCDREGRPWLRGVLEAAIARVSTAGRTRTGFDLARVVYVEGTDSPTDI